MSARRRGYTMVELLMAIAIFAIGVSGVIAMQKVTIAANQHAKSLALATHIAQAWQEQLAADAVLWNYPGPDRDKGSDLADTAWLDALDVNSASTGWIRPRFDFTGDAPRNFGPAFDPLGNPLPEDALAQAAFCTHVRLSWLNKPNNGMGLMRTEVRVFWLRENGGGHVEPDATLCSGTDPDLVEAAVERYHFVYQTSAVRQHTLP